jgi:hypothetical protein
MGLTDIRGVSLSGIDKNVYERVWNNPFKELEINPAVIM